MTVITYSAVTIFINRAHFPHHQLENYQCQWDWRRRQTHVHWLERVCERARGVWILGNQPRGCIKLSYMAAKLEANQQMEKRLAHKFFIDGFICANCVHVCNTATQRVGTMYACSGCCLLIPPNNSCAMNANASMVMYAADTHCCSLFIFFFFFFFFVALPLQQLAVKCKPQNFKTWRCNRLYAHTAYLLLHTYNRLWLQ